MPGNIPGFFIFFICSRTQGQGQIRTQGRMVNATRPIDGRIVETTRKVGSIPITSNCPAMSRVY